MKWLSCTVLLLCIVISWALPFSDPSAVFDWNKQAQETLKKALDVKKNVNVAKNVIIFLGDGMGLPTVTAARILRGQIQGQTGEEGALSFDNFPNVALSKTFNTNQQVADSAGTATAFLTGVKTSAGILGLDQRAVRGDCPGSKGKNVTSILQWSHDAGKSVGVVTTTAVTHATPGASYAKSADRNWQNDAELPPADRQRCKDIAAQLVEDHKYINVIMGGGRRNFMPNTSVDPEYKNSKGRRLDNRNLINEWMEDKSKTGASHDYVWNKTKFEQVDPAKTDYLLGLFDTNHMQYEAYRQSRDGAGEPTIAEMTKKAIQILKKNAKGFFLLVEGGRIDHAHHDNVASLSLYDTLAFDNAVQTALSETSEEDTLVVVTADHSHVFSMGGYPGRGNDILGKASGSGSSDPTLDGKPYTTLGYANGPGHKSPRQDITANDTTAIGYVQEAGIPLTSESHGGEDVGIYAKGPMAHLFHGVHEQNYIAHVMGYASCVGRNQDHCKKSSAAAISFQRVEIIASLVIMQFVLRWFSDM